MKQTFLSLTFFFFSMIAFAQVTDSQKIIKLNNAEVLKTELNLEDGKEYAFLTKDIQELFPTLIKEKKVSERFGKNAYRTKTIKVVDETQLMKALVTAFKNQSAEIQTLKSKLITIEKN